MKKRLIIICIISFFLLSGFYVKVKQERKIVPNSPSPTFEEIDKKSEEIIYNKAEVLSVFEKIAFGSEYATKKEDIEKLNKIKKWERPIIIGVVGEDIEENKMLVQKHIDEIKKHIPIQMWFHRGAADGGNGNVLMYFVKDFKDTIYRTDREQMERLYGRIAGDKDSMKKSYENVENKGGALCFYSCFIGLDKTIVFSTIFIRSDYVKEDRLSFIEEELTQSLGLTNDYKNYQYSRFNDKSIPARMTKLDWFLLQILYHEKVKSGMNKEEFEKIFDEVYKDLIVRRKK